MYNTNNTLNWYEMYTRLVETDSTDIIISDIATATDETINEITYIYTQKYLY